jgi:putative ABC transport system ATP-binding protein
MIHLKGINKIHGEGGPAEFQSLYDIGFDVAAGELGILKGVSGSGKSTLLSLVGALQRPTSGEIQVNGKSIAKLPDLHASAFRARTIGFIFQSFNLFEEFSVAENVALPLIPSGLSPKEIDNRVQHSLELANIEHKAGRKVGDLSGGEKQRTAIARALVNDAKIILCDEPTANLDPENFQTFTTILKDLKSIGTTILIATHDPLFEGLDFVDRVFEIEAGRIGRP